MKTNQKQHYKPTASDIYDCVSIGKHIATFLSVSDASSISQQGFTTLNKSLPITISDSRANINCLNLCPTCFLSGQQHQHEADAGCGVNRSSSLSSSWVSDEPVPDVEEDSVMADELDTIDDASSYNEILMTEKRRSMNISVENQAGLKEAVLSAPVPMRSYVEILNKEIIDNDISASNRSKSSSIELVCCSKCRGLYTPSLDYSYPSVQNSLKITEEKGSSARGIVEILAEKVLKNIPLSIILELSEGAFDTGLNTSIAVFEISASAIRAAISFVFSIVHHIFHNLQNLSPGSIIDAFFEIQRNFGKNSDFVTSRLKSVASNVDQTCQSAASIAIHYLKGGNGSHGSIFKNGHQSSRSSFFGLRNKTDSVRNVISDKMFRKLSKIHSTSKVVSYMEWEEHLLSHNVKERVQRMMHYEISLRPFHVTVMRQGEDSRSLLSTKNSAMDWKAGQSQLSIGSFSHELSDCDESYSEITTSEDTEASPFMCTPKSFPVTPSSRQYVLARSSRFSEDVIYLARDQLRVEDGLESSDVMTRRMAEILKEGRRLAVFNASDTANGIALTCGGHCATKVGNVLYCSSRSMISILRNVYVYFEMSVVPIINVSNQSPMASLSIGISTAEMPLNTLVGAWNSSIGLCTSGQVLNAGQWCAPKDANLSSYGNNSTIGCLVYLDDKSAFETWDGTMLVHARVVFNVEGRCVIPVANPAGNFGAPITMTSYPLNDSLHQNRQSPLLFTANESTSLGTITMCVPRDEEIFPTVTLHSPGTQVHCRFSSSDILAYTRESIGAPRESIVYTLDGSLLLGEHDDSVNTSGEEIGLSTDT